MVERSKAASWWARVALRGACQGPARLPGPPTQGKTPKGPGRLLPASRTANIHETMKGFHVEEGKPAPLVDHCDSAHAVIQFYSNLVGWLRIDEAVGVPVPDAIMGLAAKVSHCQSTPLRGQAGGGCSLPAPGGYGLGPQHQSEPSTT